MKTQTSFVGWIQPNLPRAAIWGDKIVWDDFEIQRELVDEQERT